MTAPREMRIDMTSDVAELPAVRETIRAFVRDRGWSDFDTADIVLAVDEALTNVIRHGYSGESGHVISVEVREIDNAARGRGIEIIVADRAPQVALEAIRGRDLDDIRPGGLGVHLIKSLMDDALYSHRDGGGMKLLMRRFEGRCPPAGGCCDEVRETP
jgi:serine/threonine-protein kinase RsbW